MAVPDSGHVLLETFGYTRRMCKWKVRFVRAAEAWTAVECHWRIESKALREAGELALPRRRWHIMPCREAAGCSWLIAPLSI